MAAENIQVRVCSGCRKGEVMNKKAVILMLALVLVVLLGVVGCDDEEGSTSAPDICQCGTTTSLYPVGKAWVPVTSCKECPSD